MKKLGSVILLLVFLAGCTAPFPPPRGLVQADVAGKPTVYCKVVKEPDPQLLGRWKCVWARFKAKTSETDYMPVEYHLGKYGDRYGLLFFRSKEGGDRIYAGWRKWEIDGSEIRSDTGITIFTQDGSVFFQWQADKPIKMERSQEKLPDGANP